MSVQAGYSRTTLADAAGGKTLPTLEVVRTFVQVCGADQAEWGQRWYEVREALSEEGARAEDTRRAAGPPPDRHLWQLLGAVRHYWINAELAHALEPAGRLPIRLLEHGDPARPIPESTTVLEIFQRSAQLLVLGAPGVGKSVLLLELTQRLADAWVDDPTQPVPVVLPLSSWAQRRGSLEPWLVEQLFRLYSVDRKLGRQWVRDRRVLPLLDGLDEVPAAHRPACVAAINDYRQRRGAVYPLVVTCRTNVHDALPNPLRLRHMVEVRPLSLDEVHRQLRAGGPALSGVREAIRRDPELADLVTTPLFLAMLCYTYRGRPAATIPSAPDVPAGREAFFRDYVARRLRHEFPAKPELTHGGVPDAQALRWLGWLARTLRRTNQTVFLPDLIQPDLLPARAARWLLPPRFPILVGIIAAALFGTITGLLIHTISVVGTNRPGSGLIAGVLEGVVVGVACAAQCRRREIEPTRPPRLTASVVGPALLRGGAWGVVGAGLGAPVGLWFGEMGAQQTLGTPLGLLVVGLFGWLLGGLPGGMTLGAVTGFALGTVSGLHPEPDVRPARPGAGMRDTRRVAVLTGGITAAGGTIAYGVHFGLALGAVVALRTGGAAYLCHLALRARLARAGVIPRRLLGFLHRAHTSVLLTEVAGGYKFTHPLLREYLAKAEPTATSRDHRRVRAAERSRYR
jgi:hypothetical protein